MTQLINGKACVQPQTWLVSKLTHYIPSCNAHQLAHIRLENEDLDMLDSLYRKWMIHRCSDTVFLQFSDFSLIRYYKRRHYAGTGDADASNYFYPRINSFWITHIIKLAPAMPQPCRPKGAQWIRGMGAVGESSRHKAGAGTVMANSKTPAPRSSVLYSRREQQLGAREYHLAS